MNDSMIGGLDMIGKKVVKKSGKPFKSMFKVNTVKEIIKHPMRKGLAYTFEEDDSYVEVTQCKQLKEFSNG